jgi:alpha,alpha-trehalase
MNPPVVIDPRYHDAVIFDLDGVLTDAASAQRTAWASLFNDYLARRPDGEDEDHAPFTDDDYRQLVDGKPRPDGVADFLASRGISLPRGVPSDTGDATICGLANRQKHLYADLLDRVVPPFGAMVALMRKLLGIDVAATAVHASSPGHQQLSKVAGVDSLLDVDIRGTAAEGLSIAPLSLRRPWTFWTPHADSACLPAARSSSGTPKRGCPRVATPDSPSSSVSTEPETPTN